MKTNCGIKKMGAGMILSRARPPLAFLKTCILTAMWSSQVLSTEPRLTHCRIFTYGFKNYTGSGSGVYVGENGDNFNYLSGNMPWHSKTSRFQFSRSLTMSWKIGGVVGVYLTTVTARLYSSFWPAI